MAFYVRSWTARGTVALGAGQRRRARGQLIRCMSAMIDKGGIKVDDKLVRLVERDIAPGTGVDPEHFWSAFGRLVLENAPRYRGDAGRALCGGGVRAMLRAPACDNAPPASDCELTRLQKPGAAGQTRRAAAEN